MKKFKKFLKIFSISLLSFIILVAAGGTVFWGVQDVTSRRYNSRVQLAKVLEDYIAVPVFGGEFKTVENFLRFPKSKNNRGQYNNFTARTKHFVYYEQYLYGNTFNGTLCGYQTASDAPDTSAYPHQTTYRSQTFRYQTEKHLLFEDEDTIVVDLMLCFASGTRAYTIIGSFWDGIDDPSNFLKSAINEILDWEEQHK